ncbi:hypothetical protein BDV29DRAFT_177156 [Aspergillus leporis]|uniref:Uncharacterized protein n=1 Tax=Aspergillus leporis TaxID=41062 RepID=A0A5N5WXV9_9EURO|nr:hypothetical protein BDV29DRAFT_177156 [Aspergillus leporis]
MKQDQHTHIGQDFFSLSLSLSYCCTISMGSNCLYASYLIIVCIINLGTKVPRRASKTIDWSCATFQEKSKIAYLGVKPKTRK